MSSSNGPGSIAGGLRRRELLQGAAGLAAAGLFGLSGAASARAGTARSGRRVAVFGGGPAGMTAAHELAERGFHVDLYERHEVLGGKVRSISVPGTGTGGRPDYPLNMGGHFFLSAYQSLGNTLGRIPTSPGRTVLDNLTTGPNGIGITLYWKDLAVPVVLPSRGNFPNGVNPQHLLQVITHALRFPTLPPETPILTPEDAAIIASKVMALLTSGEKRQWGQLEHLSLPDYLRTDRTSADAAWIAQLPGMLGVANHRGMNTRAFGRVLDIIVNDEAGRGGPGFTEGLSLLDGPETTAWFDPWARYLRGLGVEFHMRHTLDSISCERGRITGASVRDRRGRRSTVQADWYVLAVPHDKAAALMNRALVAADPALGRIQRLEQTNGISLQLLLKHRVPELGTLFTSLSSPWQTGNEVLTNAWSMDVQNHGDGQAREYLSIQLTDATWRNLPGMLYGKPAKDCTGDELIEEVLAQFRRYTHDGEKNFAKSAVHSWRPAPGFAGGGNKPFTVDEPLFPATPSCWQNQPEPVTKIPNFFLAGAYTRNIVIGENMDAANESGKRAAQGILEASGVTANPVEIGTFTPPPELKALRDQDDINYQLGLPNAFDIVAPGPARR